MQGDKSSTFCVQGIDLGSSFEQAATQYNYDETVEFLTNIIRRFKPQVLVTHDENGEYGHGYHLFTCQALIDAVDAANNKDKYADSVSTYGLWDTPKTYLHVYKENGIRLDLRQPLSEFGGRTALEVLQDAYKKHISQQFCWFYVSDDYEFSCADFGLYRTTVGYDTSNDILENIKTYHEQKIEEESIQESIKESESISESVSIEESESVSESEYQASIDESERICREEYSKRIKIKFVLTMVVIIVVVITGFVISKKRK